MNSDADLVPSSLTLYAGQREWVRLFHIIKSRGQTLLDTLDTLSRVCPFGGQTKYFIFYCVLYCVHSIPPYLSEG